MKFITMHGHLNVKVTVQVFSGDHLRGHKSQIFCTLSPSVLLGTV